VGQTRNPYEYVLAMFPMNQLTHMVRLTSPALEGHGMQQAFRRELLKFIGVTILAARYKFGSRAELWSTKPRNPYLVAPAFGERTGLSRFRFDALWSCVAFSEQTSGGRDESEQSRWDFSTDVVDSINAHRDAHVSPSEYICVDESMCKWYGQGGPWVMWGLPMYVALYRKPENGREIPNAACGRSEMMLRLSVVTSAEHQRARRRFCPRACLVTSVYFESSTTWCSRKMCDSRQEKDCREIGAPQPTAPSMIPRQRQRASAVSGQVPASWADFRTIRDQSEHTVLGCPARALSWQLRGDSFSL